MADLRQQIISLGPWHLDVQVTPEISTNVFLEAPKDIYPDSLGEIAFDNPKNFFCDLIKKIYPEGLEGRTVLDCACNCGAYLFWAKELGAGECVGFDIREHWINQARFLAENRTEPSTGIRFEVCNLYDLPKLELGSFDITLFHGIFYHLPDPVTGLKIAANLTRELLFINTATRNGYPDGLLVASEEDQEALMSGVYGLNWLPTGPAVLTRILKWLKFPETYCVFWRINTTNQPPEWGRLQMIASRSNGVFERLTIAEGNSVVQSHRMSSRSVFPSPSNPNLLVPRSAPPFAAANSDLARADH